MTVYSAWNIRDVPRSVWRRNRQSVGLLRHARLRYLLCDRLDSETQRAVCNKNIKIDDFLYNGWDDGAW